MSQQEKPASSQVPNQDMQQLQLTLKQTLKENKTLQSKSAKLQAKYVEVFKENKILKQDRALLLSFLATFFNENESAAPFQEPAIGQIVLQQLQNFSEQKVNRFKSKIQDLESEIQKIQQNSNKEYEKRLKVDIQKLNAEWESRLKSSKQQHSKQLSLAHRQLQAIKKSLETRTNQLNEFRTVFQQKTQQLSKVSKEKLKIEHHLNNIRKKEICSEITPPQDKDQSKTLVDKNEYLSLKQQIQNLLLKRDELKRELKKKEDELLAQQNLTNKLQAEVERLNRIQSECDQKYELVRQCSLEDLQNMILHFHTEEAEKNTAEVKNQNTAAFQPQVKTTSKEQQQTQREYFKNLVIRYIKAQTSGQFEKAVTLLQIIGKLLKIDQEATLALERYKVKQKQWWFMKI